MITTLLIWGCGSEQQIIDPNYDCESDVTPIAYELTCPEIPECPSVELSCPEVIIPECPDVNVVCPTPNVMVEAPTVINDSPDITVEPSQCNNTYTQTCECPEVIIPECPSLDSVTVELDAELTLDGEDFLSDLANLINGPQDRVFYMESEVRTVGDYILWENTDTRDFILTGVRLRTDRSRFDFYLNGDPTQDLTFLMGPFRSMGTHQGSGTVPEGHSLMGSNTGAITMAPGDTIDLSIHSFFSYGPYSSTPSSEEITFAMMGYYQ